MRIKHHVRMQAGRRLLACMFLVTLVGAGCSPTPAARIPEGPSRFLAGFRVDTIVTTINATSSSNEPRCPTTSTALETTSGGSDGSRSKAVLTTDCDDQGDDSELEQTWTAGIAAEFERLGAESTSPTGEPGSGALSSDTWEYTSGGLPGRITLQVIPTLTNGYRVIVRIVEPS